MHQNHMSVCIYVYMYICIYVYMYICMYICMYVHMYIYDNFVVIFTWAMRLNKS